MLIFLLWIGIYIAVGCFMWSVASSLRRISRDVERLANQRSLEREASRRRAEEAYAHEAKPVQNDRDWPVTP
jgi:hypothetical protein